MSIRFFDLPDAEIQLHDNYFEDQKADEYFRYFSDLRP